MINFYISEGLEGFDPYPVLVPAVPVGMDSSKLAISNVRSVRCSEDPVTITPDNIDPLHRQAEIDFLTGNGEAPPTAARTVIMIQVLRLILAWPSPRAEARLATLFFQATVRPPPRAEAWIVRLQSFQIM